MPELQEGPHAADVERVTLKGTDATMVDAVHARPDGMPVGGLVVYPDVAGLRPLFDDLCRRLATYGLAVVAPEPFARQAALSAEPAARIAAVAGFDEEVQMGDVDAAADYLVVHDDVTAVSIVGFCLGGTQALNAAASGRFERAVAFYGMVRIRPDWLGHIGEPLEHAADVCPTLAIFGEDDQLTPAADVDALRAAWAGRPDCEVRVYPGADHAFVHVPDHSAHRPADAADAWRRALDFLGVK
jgi:carboxymethylenebutenolidase